MQQQAQTKRLEAIKAAKNDRSARLYLFHRLATVQKPELWLADLRDSGVFLRPEDGPPARKVKQSGGTGIQADPWPDLTYIVTLAKRNSTIKDQAISRFLCDFINKAATFEAQREIRNFNTDASLVRALVQVPLEHLTPEDLMQLGGMMSDAPGAPYTVIAELVPRILQHGSQDLIAVLLDQVLEYRIVSSDSPALGYQQRYHSVMSNHALGQMLKAVGSTLSGTLAGLTYSICKTTMEEIVTANPKQFEWYQILTIEDSPQRHDAIAEYVHFLSDLFRDSLGNLPGADLRTELSSLLRSTQSIFRRQAIHAIGNSYTETKDLFWERYGTENPLWDAETKHELFELVKQNSGQFSQKEKETVVTWIEELNPRMYSEEFREKGEERVDQRIAYDKLEWYEFAFDQSDDDIATKVRTLKSVCNWKREIPPGCWSTGVIDGGFTGHKRPMTREATASMDTSAWIQSSKKHPGSEGHAEAFEEAVKANLRTFVESADQFSTIEPLYLYHFFRACREGCREGVLAPWDKAVDLAHTIIRGDGFWNRVTSTETHPSQEALLSGIIADMIWEITRSPEARGQTISPERVQEVILEMIEKTSMQGHDPLDIDQMLNTTAGKVSLAFVETWGWVEEHRTRNPMQNKLKGHLGSLLESENRSSPIRYIVGVGFRVFQYYDPEWCEQRFVQMFPADEELFRQSITGFFETTHGVYENLYVLFKRRGIYQRTLLISSLSDRAKESLVHHILLGGIEQSEDIGKPDSLIKAMISRVDAKTLSRATWLLWRYAQNGNTKALEQVVPIWRSICERLQVLEGDELDSVVVQLLSYPNLLPSWPEEISELVFRSLDVSSIHGFALSDLLDSMNDKWNSQPKQVADVFMSVIESKKFPTYPPEKVRALIERMFADGFQSQARRICNSYMLVGNYLLRDIQDRFSPPNGHG